MIHWHGQNWLGKRFNSRRLTQSDAERLKRKAAIESLMEVVDVATDEKVREISIINYQGNQSYDLFTNNEL